MGDTIKTHIVLHKDLKVALQVLADLEGRSLSDLLSELGREELKRRGFKPLADGQKIADEVERRQRAGQREA